MPLQLLFVLGLEPNTCIPKLGDLGLQRCTASFGCAVAAWRVGDAGQRVGCGGCG